MGYGLLQGCGVKGTRSRVTPDTRCGSNENQKELWVGDPGEPNCSPSGPLQRSPGYGVHFRDYAN